MRRNQLSKWMPQALAVMGLMLVTAVSVYAQTPEARAAKAGAWMRRNPYAVLRLYGDNIKERGFAHGWHLGERIMECLDDALKSLPFFTQKKYETRLLPWSAANFFWDAEITAELDGVFEGMQARLGEEGLRSAQLGRKVTRADLNAINAIADWFGPACSGFTAWQERTKDGQVIHGRNLDFPVGSKAMDNQFVLAMEALPERGPFPARRAWVAVTWPGLVGVYSGMNNEGLVGCLHDADNVVKGGAKDGFVERGVLLRRMLEGIDPAKEDAGEAARRMAADRPVASGNLFHLSWPGAAALKTKTKPSVVLEFDAARRAGEGQPVDLRRMDDAHFLILTNHYCERQAPHACERFEKMTAALQKLSRDSSRIDLKEARMILIGGEQRYATVAHTLVFFPDTRTLHVALTRGNNLATRVKGTTYTFAALFEPDPK